MWNRPHPGCDLSPLRRRFRRGGCCRLRNPDAGLDMQGPAGDGVADLLQIGQAEEFDVVLGEAAIGNGTGDRIEFQGFLGLVKLEIQIRTPLFVGACDEIKPGAAPRARQLPQQAQLPQHRCVFRTESHGRNPAPDVLCSGLGHLSAPQLSSRQRSFAWERVLAVETCSEGRTEGRVPAGGIFLRRHEIGCDPSHTDALFRIVMGAAGGLTRRFTARSAPRSPLPRRRSCSGRPRRCAPATRSISARL